MPDTIKSFADVTLDSPHIFTSNREPRKMYDTGKLIDFRWISWNENKLKRRQKNCHSEDDYKNFKDEYFPKLYLGSLIQTF